MLQVTGTGQPQKGPKEEFDFGQDFSEQKKLFA